MDQLDNIQNLIYVIRGQRVMLDRDLAKAYGVETKRLNEKVKRNPKRFAGDDFMFQLTKDELEYVRSRSQFATMKTGRGSNVKYLPFAFTQLGVSMLSSVLDSDTAIEANRRIMRAFVAFRHLMSLPPASAYFELKKDIDNIRQEMNDILADQNDINESTRLTALLSLCDRCVTDGIRSKDWDGKQFDLHIHLICVIGPDLALWRL